MAAPAKSTNLQTPVLIVKGSLTRAALPEGQARALATSGSRLEAKIHLHEDAVLSLDSSIVLGQVQISAANRFCV